MLTALYIHIPFCSNICTYCDFHKEIAKQSKKEDYINSLIQEIKYYKDYYSDLKTIYIGGGTPSSLDHTLLKKLFQTLKNYIQLENILEFTFECNPNDVNQSLIDLFKEFKISRVSIGVQSFNEKHLKFLGRTHNNSDVMNAIDLLNKNNITNISIDLIFAIINQTEEELLNDIKIALSLNIKHISYYSLILEEKTKLYYLYNNKKIELTEEDLEGIMYTSVIHHLTNALYNHYEISNFSVDGFQSKHNLIYWQNKDYLGLGASAHSLIDNHRYYNVANTTEYSSLIQNDVSSVRTSYLREPLREELMMGLRLIGGINVNRINDQYNINLFEKYEKLQYFIEQDILQLKDNYLSFTTKGLLLGNIVFGIF